MPDYKEMYLTMVRATEKALRILVESQQQAEEIYISGKDVNDNPAPNKDIKPAE